MNILDRAISVVAPHLCVVCDMEGSIICENCRFTAFTPLPSRCYRCHKATRQSSVCLACKRKAPLTHCWAVTHYEGAAKTLVHKLKFERVGSVAITIAESLDEQLPLLDKNTVVTFVPTANNRVRMRGYDQARLISKELAKRRGWLHSPLLTRVTTSRQVGMGRRERFEQLQEAFAPRNKKLIQNAHILLIDDVLTTGATIESSAKMLKEAGARTIDTAVFCQS